LDFPFPHEIIARTSKERELGLVVTGEQCEVLKFDGELVGGRVVIFSV
jgi:hypothetical protein